jgi:hypothetical protein
MNNHNDDTMVSPPSTYKKAKGVVLSSSNIAAAAGTDIRSAKKEEEDIFVNNHDDDDDDDKTSRRRIRVLQVKKEDDPDNEPKPNIDDDYDYSDWKAGDWCWLLPANKNKNNNNNNNISNRTQQLESQNNTNLNRRRRFVETEDDDDDINSNVNVSNRSMAADDGEDGEVLSSAPPKKKTRRCRQLNADTNTVSSIKQEECTDNDESFVAASVNRDDDDDDDYNENSNNSIKENEQGTTNNEHENERCDGYESWTEGNWCLILPHPHNDNGTSNRQLSSEVIPVTTESSTTTTLTRSRPSNELNKSTKTTGKRTIKYTRWQNEKWNEMFRQLVAYKKEHKSTSVPYNYQADPKLGNWMYAQRTNHKNDMIAQNRVDLLNSVGFVWRMLEILPWDEMFQRLVRYKMEHNSTNVPQRYIADPKLGGWVHMQRHLYSKKELSIERINRLESIGFFWDPRDAKWMEMYQKLVAYKKQYNSTQVPREYIKDHSLGNWVSNQRQVYNNTAMGVLSKKRLELLNSINFVWSVK